jgi:hypothetical protein
MKFNHQSLIDKYIQTPLESVNLEPDLLDFEKKIILEENSQIPNLVISSHCPFDKNYCFYDIVLNVSTKENIFPKEKYVLKSQQIIEEKPIDINSIFESSDILPSSSITSDLPSTAKTENNQAIEDENSVQNKIISTIKNKNYKSYTPKYLNNNNIHINKEDLPNNKISEKDKNSNEMDNEWYIIGNNIKEGPYNDSSMYYKIYKIYYDSLSKKEKVPNYIVNEKKSNIFMTMDDCFDKLKKQQEYKNQNDATSQSNQQITQAQNAIPNYINNVLFYQNQMMRYYQMKNLMLLNSTNYLLNNQNILNKIINKKNTPNKFDNLNQGNSINNYIGNANNNKGNANTLKNNYKGQNYYNNHNYNHNNNQKKNKFNNRTFNNKNNNINYINSHKNKYNTKENTNRISQDKDNNHNDPIKNENEINSLNNNNDSNIQNNQIKLTSLDVDKLFNEN